MPALWDACCHLCEVVAVVIRGCNGGGDGESTSDTLAEREKAATAFINLTTQLVRSAQETFDTYPSKGASVCQLLPDHIVPLFVLLETTERLFSLFGWGKRKRMTKAASGALANLASTFGDLISDMLRAMTQFRSFGGNNGGGDTPAAASLVGDISPGFEAVGVDAIEGVIKEVVASRDMTKERVDPFLVQIKEKLQTFNEAQ